MKLQLVGPSNTAYSLAAAAQQSLNCYLETIENGGDGKNKYVLRGRPGIRLLKNLTTIDAFATPVRGQMSGGGRLFVAAGTDFLEVSEAGALVGAVHAIADDANHSPVDILANGGQLFVVASATAYCDSGTGLGLNPVVVGGGTLGGKCNTNGKIVTWVDAPNSVLGTSDQFDVGFAAQLFYIGPGPFVTYTCDGVYNPNLLVLHTSAGVQANVDWRSDPVVNARRAAFLDGYFVANRVSSRQFNISNLLDGATWSGLDFAYKEGYPDNILAVWSEPPLLYLLGTETLEVWRNSGAASFPLERVDGGFSHTGLVGAWSCASIMGKLHMLAGGSYGGTVAVRMEGATPVRISTHAVEEALKGVAPGAINSYSYVERGHWFWVLWVLGGNSWVYDATESALQGSPQWHERAVWDGANWQTYTAAFHSYLPEWNSGVGMHVVGDGTSGKLYEQHSDFFDDDGADIRCVRALPYVYSEGQRIRHNRIDFELETGTAGTPPVVTLDWSDDRGQTWGTAAGVGTFRTLGPGVSGTYTTRYWCVGLGSSRGRVYRITIQGKGRVALIDATLDAEVFRS